jgi:Tfp pilus assembly protein PilV
MSKTYTITLPDNLEQALNQTLNHTQKTPEETILQLLTQSLAPALTSGRSETIDPDLANDPLFQLAGCITSELTDIADNHDHYIGQALYQEMHPNAQ